MSANRFSVTGNYRTKYTQDVGFFATYSEQLTFIALLALALLVPLFAPRNMLRDIDLIMIYAIAVMGLNITTGYTGLINIGQAAFMGVGAYGTAIAVTEFGLPFYLAIPVGAALAGVVGLFVGLPSLRLKYLYLAIATLAFQIIFEWTVGHLPLLQQGGAISLPRVTVFGIEDNFFRHNTLWYYLILAVLVVMGLVWRNILRTRHGRAMIAVRDNDRAASAMGISPGATKVMAFGLGSFYAGVAGGLYAFYAGAVVIEDYSFHISIQLLAMAIVGGLGSVVGSFLGPAFIVLLDRLMEKAAVLLGSLNIFPTGVDAGSALRPLAFGLAIVLFLMFEPRGLANWWRLTRAYFKKWPFKY